MFDLDRLLHRVRCPARYTGGEWNAVHKDWDSSPVRLALAYPDVYEIGMSNLGVMILYDLLNAREGVLAERVFAPWADMAAEMRAAQLPLFTLESRRPLRDFDIVGFSLGYELTYTNVLNMLDLAGIPVLAHERGDALPLIIAGGSGALNPEPLADFIDAFVMGEGENVILEITDTFRSWKADPRRSKEGLLERLSRIEGVYVPRFYKEEYSEDGRFKCLSSIGGAPASIRRRIVPELPPPVTRPVVPFVEVTHDRGAIEIQRGCTRGCRFCQASIIYRPVRERPIGDIVRAVDEIESRCGYEEISLLSLSTSDYSRIGDLVKVLSTRYRGMHLNLSLPSLRPDAFSLELSEALSDQRKGSLTFAPEAGTQRLRRAINKGIAEEDLFQTVELALAQGWKSFKLYFMIGLPTETREDVEGIVELVQRLRLIRSPAGARPNIKVNVSTFVPKPHTPFQWAAQDAEEELAWKHEILRRGLKRAETKLSWHDPKVSLLEGVMSRGDRRIGRVIHRAWQLGCLFDAWTDMFRFDQWAQAFAECGIDPLHYLRERSLDEALPWDHIDTGVSRDFLKAEFARAVTGEETPDCRSSSCHGCGLETWPEGCGGLS